MENSPGSTSFQRSIFICISWSISIGDFTSPNFPEIRGRLRHAILVFFERKQQTACNLNVNVNKGLEIPTKHYYMISISINTYEYRCT